MSALTISDIEVSPTNPDTIYAATGEFVTSLTSPGAGIFRSTDRGDTWHQLASSDHESFIHTNEIAIRPDDPNTVFCVTAEGPIYSILGPTPAIGKIFKSTNAGQSWTLVDSTLTAALDIKIDPFNNNHILVGCEEEIYQSIDGGNTFIEISGGATQITTPFNRVEIAFAPSASGVVYVSSARNNGELWKSTDHGVTWLAIDTTSQLLRSQARYNNTIWIDPTNANNLFVGGVVLKRSTDGGNSFTTVNSHYDSLHPDIHVISPSVCEINSPLVSD